jgi:hypothetical protein
MISRAPIVCVRVLGSTNTGNINVRNVCMSLGRRMEPCAHTNTRYAIYIIIITRHRH